MSFRRAIFVAFLGLGACGRGESPSAPPSTPPASPPPNLLSLPDVPDPADPRRAWLRELTGPRLTRMASLAWSCPEDSPALLLELAPLGVNCEDFLKANFPVTPPPRGKAARGKAPPAACVTDKQLRIALHGKGCAKDEIQSILGRMRLPPGAGLYEAQGPQKFRPQAANLPELELSAEPTPGARRLATPDFRAWLPAGLSKGAVVMALVPVHGAYSESLINSLTRNAASFLGRIRPPKHFRPNVEFTALTAVPPSPSPSPSPGGRPEDNKPPLMSLSTAHQDPLLQQSCFYVSQWIRARQLLAPEGEVQNARELAFRCVFLWAEDFEAAPEGLISIARLPLPLATEDGSFPFKSADEALSPSLLQSLRAGR